MEFRVVDFEKLSYHFVVYQDGLKKIEEIKESFLKEVEPIRKEMQQILLASQSGLLIDNKTEKERSIRFQGLQDQLLKIDQDAKFELSKQKEELTKEVYKQLEEVISNWSVENSIDIVIGKLEVVYAIEKLDVTNDILEILKQRNLFIDEQEKES